MTNATIDELLDKLVDTGIEPGPKLLDEIVAFGDEAIEPLRNFLHRATEERVEQEAQIYAACLLAIMDARRALPDIVALHRSLDFDAESLSIATGHFGTEALELLLPIVQDAAAPFIVRDNAMLSAQWAAAGDEQAAHRLKALLRRYLREYVDNSLEDSLDTDARLIATSAVMGLIEMRDVEAQALIEEAWDRNVFERAYYTRESIGPKLHEPAIPRLDIKEWLESYRKDAGFLDEIEPLDSAPIDWPPLLRTGPVGTFQRSTPKVGRNDPCWCGSGKKYKKCHLSEDEASIIR